MNQKGKYDAIVVGTGISGGWAAKELCENGLKTLGPRKRTYGKAYRRLSHHEYGHMGSSLTG